MIEHLSYDCIVTGVSQYAVIEVSCGLFVDYFVSFVSNVFRTFYIKIKTNYIFTLSRKTKNWESKLHSLPFIYVIVKSIKVSVFLYEIVTCYAKIICKMAIWCTNLIPVTICTALLLDATTPAPRPQHTHTPPSDPSNPFTHTGLFYPFNFGTKVTHDFMTWEKNICYPAAYQS